MRIIDRYLATLFLRNLALTVGALGVLYALIEFFERVDDFIEYGASFSHYLRYPLYKLPLMASQILPMAILLAAFATVGQLSRTQQITALRSGGVSLWQATRSLFAAGAVLSLVMLVGNCWTVPWSIRETRYILENEIEGDKPTSKVTHDLYLRDGQRILSVAHSYPHKGEIQGVMLLDFDLHFNLIRRLEAVSASYLGDRKWRLQGVTERRFHPEHHGTVGFSRQSEQILDLGRDPGELTEIWAEATELSMPELTAIGDRLLREGQDPRRYRNEWHFRLAQSFTPLIVVLLGAPFALQRGRQATLSVGIALSLGVFVLYVLLQAIGMALGNAGLLPSPLAAWAANLLLALTGGWLFLTMDSHTTAGDGAPTRKQP